MQTTKYLRDEVANIILTDEDCLEYVEAIIGSVLNIPQNNFELKLITPRINTNTEDLKYSYADAIYESDQFIVNLEVNTSNSTTSQNKNIRYLCHLILKQVGKNAEDKFKKVNQININTYDIFKKNKFIYESKFMETSLHLLRDDDFTIFDINLDILSKISYNKIKGNGG